MNIEQRREEEFKKYARAYENKKYKIKRERLEDAVNVLKRLPTRGWYLDVSCGRGEMLGEAKKLGFTLVNGTEIVPELIDGEKVIYSEAHSLQFCDNHFHVVTMLDVIEHLIPGDDELACKELARVAMKHIVISANNRPSFNKHGDDLHINKRPYEEWDALFRQWFPGKVTWLKNSRSVVRLPKDCGNTAGT